MKKVNWLWLVIIGLIALLLLFSAGMLSGWGMMGSGMMGRWGYSTFGWLGTIFMWLIPVGLMGLTLIGIVWLVQNLGGPTPPTSGRVCPNCGKGVQADWQNCPYCGTSLK